MGKKIFFLALICVLSGACSEKRNSDKKLLLTSVSPLANLIQKVAGDEFEVYSVLQPGFSPHTFNPGAEEMKKIASAQVYFKTGLGLELENILDHLMESHSGLKKVNLSQKINLLEIHDVHDHETFSDEKRQFDPHIWVSPKNALVLIKEIKNQLSLIYPEKQQQFSESYEKEKASLEILDSQISERIKGWSRKTVVELHPAWGYFARDYGLSIAGAAQSHAGHEESTSLKEFQELIEKAKKQRAAVIFIEPQLSSETAKKMAEELGLALVLVDPEGIEAKSYEEFILKNVHSMEKALK